MLRTTLLTLPLIAVSSLANAQATSAPISPQQQQLRNMVLGTKPEVKKPTGWEAQPTDTPNIAKAKQNFAMYDALRNKFDMRLGNLYAPDASVRYVSRNGDGSVFKDTVMVAERLPKYFEVIMPFDQRENRRYRYDGITFKEEPGGKVLISAMRWCNVSGKAAPFYLRMGPDKQGVWRISYEYAESYQPIRKVYVDPKKMQKPKGPTIAPRPIAPRSD